MATACRIRVLLVEDQILVRQSLRAVLQGYPNLEVIAEAGDGEEALHYVETLKPDVVLMDINMPKMDGVAATRLIKSEFPDVAVVGITITAEGYQQSASLRGFIQNENGFATPLRNHPKGRNERLLNPSELSAENCDSDLFLCASTH